MSEEKAVSVSVQSLAVIIVLTLVAGLALGVILLHGMPTIPSFPHVPGIDHVIPSPSPAAPVAKEWIKSGDTRIVFGLKEDGTVIWSRTKRIGDAGDMPPAGKVGDAGPSGK